MSAPEIRSRSVDADRLAHLQQSGLTPLQARLLAARGVADIAEMEVQLAGLIAPEQLTHASEMAVMLADAIAAGQRLLVVGDYDADGATATAVAVRGLRRMGANVDFLVPSRFAYGYGLTPEIVALAAQGDPDIIITVDNGIASVAGVEAANAAGVRVLVTDHHLPGDTRPPAACIVNPNQHGCGFASKHLAGVGVMFYVLLALRGELRVRGAYQQQEAPNLAELLDLVALGTVADLVKLDHNNRILVEQGLRRMRAGKACAGILALLQVSGRPYAQTTARDLGFSLGPRLNAAGRLEDMSLGIQCLLEDDAQAAQVMAQRLHELNLARREIESDMQADATQVLDQLDVSGRYSLSLYDPGWHQGVIGILASRIKERYHRPVFAFAQAGNGELKGSGRSIAGLHLRDALDLLSKRAPDLLLKFGGHAMAAGLTLREQDFDRFVRGFEQVASESLTAEQLNGVIEVDGSLAESELVWDNACWLEQQVWGQGFAPPLFCDQFSVAQQRIVGERHLKLILQRGRQQWDAILFQQTGPLPSQITAVYQLQTNRYNGNQGVQLVLQHWQPA